MPSAAGANCWKAVPFQFSLGGLMKFMLLSCCLVWIFPRGAPARDVSFFLLWSFNIVGMNLLAHQAKNMVLKTGGSRDEALDLSYWTGRITSWLWIGFMLFLVAGKLYGTRPQFLLANPLRLFVPLLCLWFPVCLFANLGSWLHYHVSDDIPMFYLRPASLTAVMIPWVWFCASGT